MLGNPSAPVTIQEFVDPQCPYCQEFETQVLPSLVNDYVRTGKVKIQMEPWAFIGPDSIVGQAAELAAAQQNKIFNFAEVLYDNQREENTGWITTSMLAVDRRERPRAQGAHADQRPQLRHDSGRAAGQSTTSPRSH